MDKPSFGVPGADAQPLSRADIIVGMLTVLFFMLMGAGLLTGAFFFYKSTRKFIEGAEETTGTVVGFDRLTTSPSEKDRPAHSVPVVKYTSADGRAFVVKAATWSAWRKYEYGEKARVYYSPSEPQKARLASTMELWFGPGLLFLIGGGMLLVPPFTIWRYVRRISRARSGDAS